jgi:spermidine synthase
VLGTGRTPDGGEVCLLRKRDALELRVDDRVLMSSAVHGSEAAMARVACEPLRERPSPRVLVGGLGFGYTLRAALDALPSSATVVCLELLDDVARWHQSSRRRPREAGNPNDSTEPLEPGPLGALAGHPLDDPRVELRVDDVVRFVTDLPVEDAFDAVLLDVDNGPIPFTVVGNWWLYAADGLAALYRAVRPGGTLVVWSTDDDERFTRRLGEAGFEARIERVSAKTGLRGGRRRDAHILFVARKRV